MNRFNVAACVLAVALGFAGRPSMAQRAAEGHSESVLWHCTGDRCPWGTTDSSHALVWPADAGATSARHGYITSKPVYLPATAANGAMVRIETGSATLYAGLPLEDYHRQLTILGAGESATVSGLRDGEVLSVQSTAAFSWRVTLPAGTSTPADQPSPPAPPAARAAEPSAPVTESNAVAVPAPGPVPPSAPMPGSASATAAASNPAVPREGVVIQSTATEWRCDFAGCPGHWHSHTIAWPSWAAYSDNARAGANFRRTYGPAGEVIHPYMGKWAHGCRVTAVSGVVLIIEWQRGAETWRETYLDRNETYRIDLTPPFDGAMIESFDDSPGFSVRLKKCKPQPLP
jgi:hypothetical protein